MNAILHALGWTLVHFLWQGLLIAAVVALALWAHGGRDSRVRYAVACFGLALMMAAPPVTYLRVRAQVPSAMMARPPAAKSTAGKVSLFSPQKASRAEWRAFVDRALPWAVLTWGFGSLLMSLRLTGAWVWLQWLRRRPETQPASDRDQLLLLRLCQRMGVGSNLRLLVSRSVPGPTVLGWLRPVILIPPAMLGGLTPQALELILAHELAHVLRHDYLVNLFQSIVEVLLFFHPAVWWVSKQIRREREQCCDDLAVRVCGDALDYAEALTTLEALALKDQSTTAPRLALGARGDDFMFRIHRLISPTHPTRRSPRAGLAILVLLGAGFGLQARAGLGMPDPASPATSPSQEMRAYTGAKLTVDLQKVDLPTFLRILAHTAKLNLVLDHEIQGSGDFAFKDTPWDQILDAILPPRGYSWEMKNGVLHIARSGKLQEHQRFTAGLLRADGSRSEYSGRKVSLDIQNASLQDLLGRLASEGGIAIRIDSDAQGRYSFKFNDTPWDQILDVVLMNASLGWEIQGDELHVMKAAR
jgi:beta-lactamase regulating signal transducer with metallopeptidase domain